MPHRAAAVLLALLATVPAASAVWQMDGRDAGRSMTAPEPIPTRDVALAWESAPGVQYTGLFVAADGSIAAIGDPVAVYEPDGTLRWSTREIGENPKVFRARGGALLSDGTIVTVGHPALAPAAVAGFDPKDGKQTFITLDIGRKCDSLEDNPIAVAADDSFYVGGCEPSLFAFTKDGALKWKVDVRAGRVALGGSNVYAQVRDFKAADGTEHDRAIVAFAQADGKVAWAHPALDGATDPMVGKDGTVYFVGNGITALSPADGSVKWERLVPRPFAIGIAPNGTIMGGSANVVSWVDPANGDLLGASPSSDGRVMIAGNGVHLRGYGAGVRAWDPAGKKLWEVTLASSHQSNLAFGADGTMYVAVDGKLLAFKGQGGSTTPPSSPTSADPPTAPDAGEARGNGEKGTPAPAAWLALAAVAAGAAGLARRRR